MVVHMVDDLAMDDVLQDFTAYRCQGYRTVVDGCTPIPFLKKWCDVRQGWGRLRSLITITILITGHGKLLITITITII
jgi:hypothetical protein